MSITDELREYAEDWGWLDTSSKEAQERIEAIADRIDAEHERQLEVLYRDMSDAEYVKLPVDADGVTIHVGDMMDAEKVGGGFCEPFEVVGYIMSNGELEPIDKHKCPRKSKYLHHHHAPTVEDVLREFYSRYCTTKPKEEDDAILAEFAAKLKLADDAE